jgi:hypothetical protein
MIATLRTKKVVGEERQCHREETLSPVGTINDGCLLDCVGYVLQSARKRII